MKVRYVRNQRRICPNIIRIYKLVLEQGYKIKRIYRKDPDYDDVVILQLWKGNDDWLGTKEEIVLYPPDRTIFRAGHGKKT